MKFITVFILFFALTLRSQTQNVFSLKPALGINGCQIHGDSYSGYNKLGLFGGAAVNARLNEKASLELGFYFSQKGARHNPNPDNGDYSFYKVNLNYIDFPLSFRYLLNERFFATASPSFAYLINYSEDNEVGNWNGQWQFNKFEIGLNAGLGMKLNDKLSVEVRFVNSITPIRAYGILANQVFYPNPVARFFNRGLYNNVLSMFFAYHIDLKKKNGD